MNDSVDGWAMGLALFGGLGVFLLGMEQLTAAMRVLAGRKIRNILAKLTSSRVVGAVTGAAITAVIQSSSVTTVLVVGFVSAGLMSMSQSVGVIMGANVGTTITAQVVAFKVTKAALPLVGTGFVLGYLPKQESLRRIGESILGLGLIFLGMNIMSQAMTPLRSYQPFLDLMTSLENPLLGILVAAAFTGLVQSSSATTGIVIATASQGLISLPAGIALMLGANVGTCVTAGLAAIGKPREAQRVAVVHVAFNVIGVLLWVGLVDQLASLVSGISPTFENLNGQARLAAESPRQIANAHTLFNVANTLLLLPFSALLARSVMRLVPDAAIASSPASFALVLPEVLMKTPPLALDAVRREVQRMGEVVLSMLDGIMPAIFRLDTDALKQIEARDAEVDDRHAAIVQYLGRLSTKSISPATSDEIGRLLTAANHVESIGDLIETNLVRLGFSLADSDVQISDATRQKLLELSEIARHATAEAIQAIADDDKDRAQRVVDMKPLVANLAELAEAHQAHRLVAEAPNRLVAYTNEVDIIEQLKRIFYFAKRIAKLAS